MIIGEKDNEGKDALDLAYYYGRAEIRIFLEAWIRSKADLML